MKLYPLAFAVLALPLPTLAANSIAPQAADSAEEILITGDNILRERLMAAEKRAYDVFNAFNDERRFEISCNLHSPIGTVFVEQVCMPEFQLDALRAQGTDYLESLRNFLTLGGLPDGSVVPTTIPAEAVIASQMPDYRRKMKEVAEQHPEFREALIEYTELRAQFESPSSR